ncbi:hypothetical protein C8Q74DRAFT_834763 [Fomes fomentarius]|nr:hypothetical protein C8Q74DRAFT_834763 [Fomes fomentarius]
MFAPFPQSQTERILDTIHVIVLAYTIFQYAVVYHGDPTNFARSFWLSGAMVIISEISNSFVRLGYAYKIWRYSRNMIVAGAVTVLALVLLIMATIFGAMQLKLDSFKQLHDHLQWSFYMAYALQLVNDLIIAVEMVKVCAKFHTGLSRLDRIVRTIIIYKVNTGILAVVLNTLSLAFWLTLPSTYLYLATYWVLAKLHTCSLLGVLNAEKDLAMRTTQNARRLSPILTTAVRLDDVHTGLPSTPSQLNTEVTRLVTELVSRRESYEPV